MSTIAPIRVGMIIGKWNGGGVEKIIMDYYRHIDHNKIRFDFIFDEDSTQTIPYEEINFLGGNVIIVPPYQKIFKYIKELKRIFKENDYKIVHSNINSLSVFPLYAAKVAGVPIRISHCHSTSNKIEIKRNIIKNILKLFSKVYATDYFACSEVAGKWLFGKKAYKSGKVTIIKNAIDIEKFGYKKEIKEAKRKELGIEDDALVIGHVGRFEQTKNHDFVIDIFNELHKRNKKSILLLIGQGNLQNIIKEKVEKLNLKDSVKFLGQRDDVNEIYQAMDIFLFPSLYEGLGIALIEAQCTGMLCVCSTNVPEETKITNNLIYLSLQDSVDKWCDKIEKLSKNFQREDCSELVEKSGFDITKQYKELENIYLELYRRENK